MNKGTIQIVPLFLALLIAPAMHGETIYTYTGNPFTTVDGEFTTSMRITGSFTLDVPLADNLSGVQITPTDYSFFNGIVTDFKEPIASGDFFVSTNGTGAIDAWNIELGGLAHIESCSNSVSPLPMCSPPTVDGTATPFGGAIVTADAGSWTMTTTQVPEPSTLTLLLAAMISVGGTKLLKNYSAN